MKTTPEKLVYLASDHGGYQKKELLVTFLLSLGFSVVDAGAFALDRNDDYPKFGAKVAREVEKNPRSLGILLCRSGQGMCVVANKFRGVRAAVAWSEKSARHAREDDHANVLCLAADYFSFVELKKIVAAWLKARPSSSVRHRRRLAEIKQLEK